MTEVVGLSIETFAFTDNLDKTEGAFEVRLPSFRADVVRLILINLRCSLSSNCSVLVSFFEVHSWNNLGHNNLLEQ